MEEDAKKRKLNLLAVRAAVRSERNGDMFSEGDLFGEKYLVGRRAEIVFCNSLTQDLHIKSSLSH